MAIWPKIIASLAAWSAGKEMNRFFQATNHLQAVQQKMLQRQLKIIAGSDFARDFKLDGVDSYRQFKSRLPIFRYDRLSPYIDQLKKGNPSALFGPSEKLVMFALTSGTTAEPKYIPVTQRSIHDYRRGWNIFGLKALLDHPHAFMRKIIQMTSDAREIQTSGGVWAGAITGLLAETQKWIVRKHYVTPLCVSKIKDPTARMYVIACLAIREDVAFMNTANPSTTLRLAQIIERYGDRMIRDLHDGRIRPPTSVDSELTDACRFSADTRCAARLESLLNTHQRLLPKHIWNLAFINNWTGGTLKLYLQKFDDYFGATPIRDLGLLASEGRFSIPVSDHTPAGILEITSNFFEFIPEAEYAQPDPPVLTADQVEVGEKYFLVFSNATGLCRYDIGDLVRVVDFYNQTPMIEFLNKGAHASSITGEKITERQVVEAVGLLGRELGMPIDSFQIQPKWSDPPYYLLTLEESIGADNSSDPGRLFDRILGQINIEYQSKRDSRRLGPVQLQRVPDGYFQQDDLQRLASAGRNEQYKRKFLVTQIQD